MSNVVNSNCKGDWYDLVCASTNNNLTYEGATLPRFPDEQTQINTTGAAGPKTLCEAYIFYEDCMTQFRKSPNINLENKKLLDFGVGWGRILRFFVKDFIPDNLYGVDINKELLELCESTFDWGNFIKCEAFPPINIPDNSVDFIVSYSVFSHLSEQACLKWVEEFKRILRPGGMVALTTRGRWFIDYCESLKGVSGDSYSVGLSQLFSDFEHARKQYDGGEFLHANGAGVTGGGPLHGGFYGETFISEAYAQKVYSNYFNVVEYVFTPDRATHPIIFLQQ